MGRMQTATEPGESSPHVRGLELPALLADLLATGRWQHPGDDVLRRALPWFESPLVFLRSTGAMERESASLDADADDDRAARYFQVTRGTGHRLGLPWLDARLAFCIAVNRTSGDDVAIALDYRGMTFSGWRSAGSWLMIGVMQVPARREGLWGPDQRTGGSLDGVLDELRRRVPRLVVERLVVSHPADDDNVFFIGDQDGRARVQVDTWPGGQPPFLIEDTERAETGDPREAVGLICAGLDRTRANGGA
jgi:hypothetical protein